MRDCRPSMILRDVVAVGAVVAGVIASGCGHGWSGFGAAEQTPTFARDVAPILFEHCAPCHHPGGAGPFSLLSYSEARKRARQIAKVTSRRYMETGKGTTSKVMHFQLRPGPLER